MMNGGWEFDDYSKQVAEAFDFLYKIGRSIEEILRSVGEIRERYLQLSEERNKIGVKKEYYKWFWVFKSPYIKRNTIFDYKGEIIEQANYDYNFSWKNIKKLKKAKTDEEKFAVFIEDIQIKGYEYRRPVNLTVELISIHVTDNRKIFKALIKYVSGREFSAYLDHQNREGEPTIPVLDTENIGAVMKSSNINWTNGGNNIEFVKLIYALHHARLIDDGKGEITKIVEQLAPVFNVSLSKSWQSNFSKHKNDQNHDYDHTALFDRLKTAFSDYLEKSDKKR